MVVMTAVGRILNAQSKGVIGYRVKDSNGEVYNYRMKDVVTLAKQDSFTNLELDVNKSIKVVGKKELENWYYVESTNLVVDEEAIATIEIENEEKKAKREAVVQSECELVNIKCDNLEYSATVRVFNEKAKEAVSDIIEGKIKCVKDRFKGRAYEFTCSEEELEDVVDAVEANIKIDDVAIIMYDKDDEYIGNYVVAERKLMWFNKVIKNNMDERIIERVQEICELVGDNN